MHTVAHFMCEWIFAPFCFPFPSSSMPLATTCHAPYAAFEPSTSCMLCLYPPTVCLFVSLSHCPSCCSVSLCALPSGECFTAEVFVTISPPFLPTRTYTHRMCVCAKVLCTYPSEPSGSIINVNFYAIIALSLSLSVSVALPS